MVANTSFRVALILYTQGLDYDDRIRKEIISIQKINPKISFKIFAVEPNNRNESGVTSYGVPYKIPFLKSREKYSSGTHTLSKAWDFYKSIRSELKHFDAIWCADCETFLFVLLTFGKPIVWDLHELPAPFMGSRIKRLLFSFLEHKCKVVVHANRSRLEYLDKLGMIGSCDKHYVLRNYPQFNEIDSNYDDTYLKFVEWQGDNKCIYLQGIGGNPRADIESIHAVILSNLKAVAVGHIQEDRMKILNDMFGEETLVKHIFFTGRIKQIKTPQYIKRCFMALCFYKKISMNNWYCEPNRLFQNVINGNPVVVGHNPPMKDFVEQYKCGVCVDTDGSDVEKIVNGIKHIQDNYNSYKDNLQKSSKEILWDSQDRILRDITSQMYFKGSSL